MEYTIKTFRGYLKVQTYGEAWIGAVDQVETITAEGWGLSMQWAEIKNFVGDVKLVFHKADGTIGETPWKACR